ncbi:hypothetical protein HDC93_004756 [Streptomyces sp. AK010]|nr:hypothetical protein [Streptomyces sp. AK010]
MPSAMPPTEKSPRVTVTPPMPRTEPAAMGTRLTGSEKSTRALIQILAPSSPIIP